MDIKTQTNIIYNKNELVFYSFCSYLFEITLPNESYSKYIKKLMAMDCYLINANQILNICVLYINMIYFNIYQYKNYKFKTKEKIKENPVIKVQDYS